MTDKQTKANQSQPIREIKNDGANIPAMQPVAKLPPVPTKGTASEKVGAEGSGQSSNAPSSSN
jgi:hypothetical protein